jgi:hypothetical protein
MKTTLEMAREAGFWLDGQNKSMPLWVVKPEELKAFAELVRADERDACAELVYNSPPSDEYESQLKAVYEAIRNRGNT